MTPTRRRWAPTWLTRAQRWLWPPPRDAEGAPTVNPFWRRALLIYAVLLLSLPSALGVQQALAPTRGWAAATLAAIGFELLYLSTSVLLLNDALQRFARRVALSAVGTAIVLNVLADYSVRAPLGLASWDMAQQRFDPLALGLSLLESAPLAGLAYAGATLLHRLSAADVQLGDVVAPLRAELASVRLQLAHAEAIAAQHEQARTMQATLLSQHEVDVAALRAELVDIVRARDAVTGECAALIESAARLRADAEQEAKARAAIALERDSLARCVDDQARALAELRTAAAEQEAELAEFRAAPISGDLDLLALAQALRRAEPVPWREIEVLLRRPQSTVRGWLA